MPCKTLKKGAELSGTVLCKTLYRGAEMSCTVMSKTLEEGLNCLVEFCVSPGGRD